MDRNRQMATHTITTMPTVPPAQPDEFLRRSKIETAQAAVKRTAHRLATTHLPFDERWQLAREHETNLRHLAVLRTEAGIATDADRRVLYPAGVRV
jgi:hypothetical protein